jgi:hypothetical protein
VIIKQPKINLINFRKEFNIPSDFIRSTCKILNIEIIKINNEQEIPLNNQLLNIPNDTILLYAFNESKSTGRIEKTKQKRFDDDDFNILSAQTDLKREKYIIISNEKPETQITKKPKEAIDITSTSIDVRKEEFITLLAKVVSKSISNQNKSVLNTQEELHNAMEKNWLLTNEQLGTLLGMSKSTIGSKPDGWVRMGFKYSKIKEGTMTLWRVSQYLLLVFSILTSV